MFPDSNLLLQMAEPGFCLGTHGVHRSNSDFYHWTHEQDEREHKTGVPACRVTLL